MAQQAPKFSFGPSAAGSGSATTPSSSGSNMFGNAGSGQAGGNPFGNTTSSSSAGPFSSTPGTTAPSGELRFGQKDQAADAPKPAGNMFSSNNSNLFSSTPSTTRPSPFGPTPGADAAPKSTFGNFGSDSNRQKPLFGNSTQTPAASSPDKEQGKSLFAGFTGFGTPAKPSSTEAGSITPVPSLFGNAQSTTPAGPPPSTSGFSASTGTSNLFNLSNKPESSQPSSNKGMFSFPSSSAGDNMGSTPTTTAPAPSGNLFSQPPISQAPGQSNTNTTSAKVNFSFDPATTSASSAPSSESIAPAIAPKPFSNLFGSQPSATSREAPASKPALLFPSTQTTSYNAPGTTSAGTAAPAPAPLFPALGQNTTSASQTTASATAASAPPASTAATSTFQPSLSTIGPAPTPGSRLKNKTMDEILTRWATDLNKYTKEFRGHAETVRDWDQKVASNIEKISKLYVETIKSEKEMQAVEWHLKKVEDEQDRLERMLDMYESEVDQLLAKSGVDQSTAELGGPDQERERTYKLAEKLGDHLDQTSKGLAGMIEEVNAVTAGMSNGKADEPITEIVKVLNSHLSQLQEIDRGTATLQAKVNAAQTSASRLGFANGFGGNSDNQVAVKDFYKSYIGRRS